MTAATGDPSPWPAADIRISTLPYELLARVIFHARARVIIARCASGESVRFLVLYPVCRIGKIERQFYLWGSALPLVPFVEPDGPLDREPVLLLLLAVSDIAWSIICPPRARSGRKYLTWPSASRARSIALMVEFWLALVPGALFNARVSAPSRAFWASLMRRPRSAVCASRSYWSAEAFSSAEDVVACGAASARL